MADTFWFLFFASTFYRFLIKEPQMKEKLSTLSIVLSIAAICISAVAIVMCFTVGKPDGTGEFGETDVQYVLYLGTNDKDTDKPVYTPEEAKSILNDILIARTDGYTIQDANGGWISDDGTEYQEYSLVINLSNISLEKVHAICDELIQKYNQASILIQSGRITNEYYYGSVR